MHDGSNPFPHDGEHGRSCTGYGCDCDEKIMAIIAGGLLLGVVIVLLYFGLWLLCAALLAHLMNCLQY